MQGSPHMGAHSLKAEPERESARWAPPAARSFCFGSVLPSQRGRDLVSHLSTLTPSYSNEQVEILPIILRTLGGQMRWLFLNHTVYFPWQSGSFGFLPEDMCARGPGLLWLLSPSVTSWGAALSRRSGGRRSRMRVLQGWFPEARRESVSRACLPAPGGCRPSLASLGLQACRPNLSPQLHVLFSSVCSFPLLVRACHWT